MRGPDHQTDHGFTIVELTIAVTVLVPILLGIVASTQMMNSTMDSNTRAADVSTYTRRMAQRVAKLVRPAQMSSIRVRAVQADVDALRATAVGEWILPTDLIWRPGIEFTSASGLLSMNARLSTTPRRVDFRMEAGETDNGVDDDGDGLVDEGEIILLQNSVTLAILRDVEQCEFALDGRVLQMRLRVARRDRERRVYRNFIEQHFYLRNN